MSRHQRQLPQSAQRFLKTNQGKNCEVIVRRFHRWLDAKHVALPGLRADEIENFFKQPFRTAVKPRTARLYKNGLIAYLYWLGKKGIISFDPKALGIRNRRPLGPLAELFISSLEPTLKPGTCRCYRVALTRFHEWLDDARIKLKTAKRDQIEQWVLALKDEGLHPSTRVQAILQVRCYLEWLDERGELKRDPNDLLRSSDLPKLPVYLPRPLPIDVDRQLQESLAHSSDPRWLGLLLMRQTGLRVGELAALEHDCIRTDHDARRFLKVPLGKLNSERLVPITGNTYELICRLQNTGGTGKTYLIELMPGEKTPTPHFNEALRDASKDIEGSGHITSHRLRHSYATSLLNGGMSMLGLMKLLGHRDYRMTMRYAAITQQTVGREYHEAVTRIESKYAIDAASSEQASANYDPCKTLDDLAAWLHNVIGKDTGAPRRAQALTKRLLRIRTEIESLVSSSRS